jgi:sugar lactone lactonase YvrE
VQIALKEKRERRSFISLLSMAGECYTWRTAPLPPKGNLMSKLVRLHFCVAVCAVPLFLTGCANNGTAAGPSSTTLTATYVYTLQGESSGEIVEKFNAGASGNSNPATSLNLPSTFTPNSLSTDASGNLYVGGSMLNGTLSVGEVLVYASGATGSATPTRTITFSQTFVSMVVSGTTLYTIGYYGGIMAFNASTSGAAVATKTIDGALTTLDANTNAAVGVDGNGNVYAEESTSSTINVVEFASTASGNVAPTRTLSLTGFTYGMAVDATGNIYVSQNLLVGTGYGAGQIAVFGASGTTPGKTLVLTGSTSSLVGGLQADRNGNIFAILSTASGYEVATVGSSQTGSVTAEAVMTSSSLSNAYPVLGIQ